MSRAAGHAERLGASICTAVRPRWWSPSEATAIWPSPGPRLTCPIGVDDDSEHLR
jgi:hypothetical protein